MFRIRSVVGFCVAVGLCSSVVWAHPQACCFDDQSCVDVLPLECNDLGGWHFGDGIFCVDVGCGGPEGQCRITGGGVDCAETSNGVFYDGMCSMASGQARKKRELAVYTFGGQCGAPGSAYGEWTHRHHSGSGDKFTFHVGTSSAPADTFLKVRSCSDAPACDKAAANGENKQIVCEGVGSFKNGDAPGGGVTDRHAVRIFWGDYGEPGKNGKMPSPGHCADDGYEGAPTADCGCPDYYHITIHETSDPASPVIYDVRGYITGGNFQMHDNLIKE